MVQNSGYIKKHLNSLLAMAPSVRPVSSFVGIVAMFFNFTEDLLIKEIEP